MSSHKALRLCSSPGKYRSQDTADIINDNVEDAIESKGEHEMFKTPFIDEIHSFIIFSHLI